MKWRTMNRIFAYLFIAIGIAAAGVHFVCWSARRLYESLKARIPQG
jgi:cell division protein FtsL